MPDETFLLSGDQIATFNNAQATYPGGVTTINLHGVKTLGGETSRFFLVRTTGDGNQVQNGQFFTVYPAVSDGTGGLKPGAAPLFAQNYATPDAYNNTGAGDSYCIFGLFGGTKFAVNLDGFNASNRFTAVQGQDATGGDHDGELDLAEIAAANPDLVVCFTRGTLLATPEGDVPIERLKIGDLVLTADSGPQPLRWIGCTRIALGENNRHLRPVRIARGALGPDRPSADVRVSPAHRILLDGAGCQIWLGADEALAAAHLLVDGCGITRDESCGSVEYWHLIFDRHEIVYSSGLASESFHPGDYAVASLSRELRRELFELFPGLQGGSAAAGSRTARMTVRAFEASVMPRLLEWHA